MNDPADRDLSGKLYAGGPDMRLRQEWILGVGGVRVLRAVGIEPAAWHANEGHAAFMFIERLRELTTSGSPVRRCRRRGASPQHLHHPHAGAGRPRPLRAGPGASPAPARSGMSSASPMERFLQIGGLPEDRHCST